MHTKYYFCEDEINNSINIKLYTSSNQTRKLFMLRIYVLKSIKFYCTCVYICT